MNPYYKDYSEYMSEIFPGLKVQKISVNASLGCPNRDGTIGLGGCIYCSNSSFTPAYCMEGGSVTEQLRAGVRFFSRKYPKMRYLAYFQSFTNTFHSRSASLPEGAASLADLYMEALRFPGVEGLVVGTRPDCVGDAELEVLKECAAVRPVFVELGAESSFDSTLRLVNRGHTWEDVVSASRRLADAGLHVGLHLICGLPGERPEDTLTTVSRALELPVDSLKIHHLQVLEGTALARMVSSGEVSVPELTLDGYLDLCCRIVRLVDCRVCIERFLASAPPSRVLSPRWGLKNHEFTDRLLLRLRPEHSQIC